MPSPSTSSPDVIVVRTLADPIPRDCPIGAHYAMERFAHRHRIPYDSVGVLRGHVYSLDLPDGHTTLRVDIHGVTLRIRTLGPDGDRLAAVDLNGMTPDSVADAILDAFLNESLRDD